MPDFEYSGMYRRRLDLQKIITAPEITALNFVNAGSHTFDPDTNKGKSFEITRMDFVE